MRKIQIANSVDCVMIFKSIVCVINSLMKQFARASCLAISNSKCETKLRNMLDSFFIFFKQVGIGYISYTYLIQWKVFSALGYQMESPVPVFALSPFVLSGSFPALRDDRPNKVK